MTSKKEHALALAARGFRVFPLATNGKTPANEGNWRKSATTDPARISEMWSCPVMGDDIDYNIGIALDIHTLVVDVDVRNGKQGAQSLSLLEAIYDELPATYTVTTASGGEHRYFTVVDSGVFAKTLATDIDLKGEGGYVVGPGSEIDGREYLRSGHDAVGVPVWLSEIGARPTADARRERMATGGSREAVGELDTESAIARATEWLERHAPEAVEGAGGDNVTIQVANRVGDFGISRDKATELMLDWNDTKASPPWDTDELAEKVASAFRSRQNPIGIASAEAEFDAVEVDAKPSPKKGLHYITWKDAAPDFEQPYLIDGVLDLATMAVTYGDSNTGKTYVKLDQAFHIAAGRDWNGRKVRQGAVVYIAAEGGRGFSKRVAAFKKHYEVEDLPFAIVPCTVDLFSEQGDTAKLVKLVRQVESDFGQKCVLIVVDTLARAMAGGDENTSADMGKFVRNCDKLREAIGATVNIIHHTGKDKAKGARGSSALRAATDTEIEIDVGKLAVTKQRDMAKGEEMHFELVSVEIGHRSDGQAVSACVVQWVSASEFEARVSPAALEMLGVLKQLVAAEQAKIEDETGNETNKSDIKIEWQMWQMSLLDCMKGARGKSINRTALFVLRRELYENGLVKKDKANQWFVP